MSLPNWDNGKGNSHWVRRGIHVVGDGERVVKNGVNEFERPGLAKINLSVQTYRRGFKVDVRIVGFIGPTDGNHSTSRRVHRSLKDECWSQRGDESKGTKFKGK